MQSANSVEPGSDLEFMPQVGQLNQFYINQNQLFGQDNQIQNVICQYVNRILQQCFDYVKELQQMNASKLQQQ